MFCDNQGAIALSKDNKFHSRHINLHYHFIREAVNEDTAKNVADIFTKALVRPKFEYFMEKLG